MVVRWLTFAQDQLKGVVQYVMDNFGVMTAKKSLRKILNDTDTLGKYRITCKSVWIKHRFS